MEVTVEKGKGKEADTLVIRMPLGEPTLSASKKNMVVASTRGNLPTDCKIDGNPLTIGVNAYYRA
ncbi:MAG: hypothetical protein GY835_22675 [bacterium]|nr:hypothetical protein [bacterium]